MTMKIIKKPRIRKLGPNFWECDGQNIMQFGNTPELAYAEWYRMVQMRGKFGFCFSHIAGLLP